MKELFGEQPSAIEKKPEIITDAEKVRETMQTFWHRETDPESLKNKLGRQEEEHTKDLLGVGYEMEVLRRTSGEKKAEFPIDPAHFIFTSQNETKRRIVAETAKEQKLFLQETMFPVTQKEEEWEHQILRQLIRENRLHSAPKAVREYAPEYFAIDVAEAKVSKMHETYKNRAIIGADIVALCGNQILEKPKNREEALEILKSISDKEIKTSFGCALLTPTSFGKTVLMKEGGCFNIKLRDFSEKEASEYLDRCGKNYLDVVGTLDYASPLTKRLISDAPISIEPLQFEKKAGDAKKQILISPDLLPQLKDYFMGTPRELIQEILKQGKILQEGPQVKNNFL